MLPPYVIGCTARDGHVVRGLNRYERAFGLSLSVVHVLQTFLLVLLCVFFCCLLVLLWVFFVPAEQFSSQLRFP